MGPWCATMHELTKLCWARFDLQNFDLQDTFGDDHRPAHVQLNV